MKKRQLSNDTPKSLGKPIDLVTLSLGAGVQSSALYILSCLGRLSVPRADVAIFADTGDEACWTYDQLDRLERWGNIPIVRVTRGSISEATLNPEIDAAKYSVYGSRKRIAFFPGFTPGKQGRATGQLRRRCTPEFKIEAINQYIREHLGYKAGERVQHTVLSMIGFSYDEKHRCSASQLKWIVNSFPLVYLRLSRKDCQAINREWGKMPNVRKSACVFCPYKRDDEWEYLKRESKKDFERAVEFDEGVRDSTKDGAERPVYVHRSLRPLGDIDFSCIKKGAPTRVSLAPTCDCFMNRTKINVEMDALNKRLMKGKK